MLRLLITISLLSLLHSNDADERLSPALTEQARTVSLTIKSAHLNKVRDIVIREPIQSLASDKSVLNLYVLDADWNFPLIASYIDYLSYYNMIPSVRVIGIYNDNRNSDFINTADPRFPNTGLGAKFQHFMDLELRPLIAKKYPAQHKEIVFGHSFGGVAAMTHLLQSPNPFDAYLAVGTSVWVSDYWLLSEFKKNDNAQRLAEENLLYFSVAEFDGGETVPSNKQLADWLKANDDVTLDWHYEVIETSNHFTAVMPSFKNAIEWLFDGWTFLESIKSITPEMDASEVSKRFQEAQNRLGYRFWPISDQLSMLSFQWASSGREEQALVLMNELLEFFPDDPSTHSIAAYVYFVQKDTDRARRYISRAIALGEQQKYNPNRVQMYRDFQQQLAN